MLTARSHCVIPLVGAPNSGKTTLFNWLTAAKFKTVNYPGATVDYALGTSTPRYGDSQLIMDTPGTYSLHPKSPEEEVTYRILFSEDGPLQNLSLPVVVVVVDATQLHKHLYLAYQLKAAQHKIILAVTMIDLIEEENLTINWNELSQALQCPVVPIDGRLGGGVDRLLDEARAFIPNDPTEGVPEMRLQALHNWDSTTQEEVRHEIETLVNRVVVGQTQPSPAGAFARTGQLDQILLHETWGVFFLAMIMILLFSSIFWLAAPLMDFVDQSFAGLASLTESLLGPSPFADFLSNGLIAGVGAVMVFVPQILILFLGIGLLEDSGYLARAATLVDRPFSRIGLNGRSFVPILSGFACAVPAMLATRTISSRKERWITLFILPFMTCSARLPVYALLLSFLFAGAAPWKPGVVLALIYILSLLIGGVAGAIVARIIPQPEPSFFLMELPYFRRPQLKFILVSALHRTQKYLYRAGPVIFTLAVAMWLAAAFPRSPEPNSPQQLENSYLGQAGKILEPVFTPMGADWRVGVSLLTAFAAREVFVSNLAVMMNVGSDEDDDDSLRHGLIQKMNEARTPAGQPLFSLASVLGLIVFFMLALQCTSTVAMAARESGSWGFALGQLVFMNLVAYGVAVACVQGLRSIGVA